MTNLNEVGECDFRVAKAFWINCFPYMEQHIQDSTCRWNKEKNYIFLFGSVVKREDDRWYENYPTFISIDEGGLNSAECEFATDVWGTLESLLISKAKRQFGFLIDDFFLDIVKDGRIKQYSSKCECAKRGFKFVEGEYYLDDEDE